MGDQFRRSFARIGNLRSLLPKNVNVMALTATATAETLDVVIQRLSMHNVYLVAMPPRQNNILFALKLDLDIQDFTDIIVQEFLQMRLEIPKTIVYVRSYADCIAIYQILKSKMGSNFTEPVGYPNLTAYKLVEMYTRVLPAEKKDQVLQTFSLADGKLRLVIATTAFGMGVDCQDISRVMHYGAPSTLEEYIQEMGRAGRNGKPARGELYVKGRKKYITYDMKRYIENFSECRRKLLFQKFLMYSESMDPLGCACCDIGTI